MNISVIRREIKWDEKLGSFIHDYDPIDTKKWQIWYGATCRGFASIAGAKRSIKHSKEAGDYLIVSHEFEGGNVQVSVYQSVKRFDKASKLV